MAVYYASVSLREAEAENSVLQRRLAAAEAALLDAGAATSGGYGSEEGGGAAEGGHLETMTHALMAASGAQTMLEQELVNANARAKVGPGTAARQCPQIREAQNLLSSELHGLLTACACSKVESAVLLTEACYFRTLY